MFNTLRLPLLTALAVILLVSSGQRYLPILLQHTSSPHTLYLGVMLGSDEALSALSRYARENQDEYWLELVAEAGDARAYYLLALNEEDEERHTELLHQAAAGGHAKAQYELALLSDSTLKRVELLQRAAYQQYLPAMVALYQWYLHQDEPEQARPWLEQAALRHGPSALIHARQLWRQGDYQLAREAFVRASEFGVGEAQDYVELIKKYWPGPQAVGPGPASVMTNGRQCEMQIQPVVTSLENMRQLQSLAQTYHDDPRLSELPICLLKPIWLGDDRLNCDANWQGRHRLGCDEARLAELPLDDRLTHLLVLAPLGKANVHNGIMYLDLTDGYSVFVHELAHFAGFVDEYPLSSELAEQICHPHRQPPNLIFTHSEEALSDHLDKWRETAMDWRLAKSRTCNNHPLQAYKASDRLTFMEYHDQAYIPPLYLKLWQQQLADKRQWLPAYINIAQALEHQGRADLAEHWWQKRDALYQTAATSDPIHIQSTAIAPD
ncbi:sel1 repeat family protein [Lacimicrobium sp. SS2-24]|uniref:tetratricopeptide repeat protein n=1 Tax=Lacimicrobium sp. SS2-24 TaxID=2005569 RepID=UPI0011300CA3|nr:sel1 repeat family protein [Lacimicrobium sp. SS2-24]